MPRKQKPMGKYPARDWFTIVSPTQDDMVTISMPTGYLEGAVDAGQLDIEISHATSKKKLRSVKFESAITGPVLIAVKRFINGSISDGEMRRQIRALVKSAEQFAKAIRSLNSETISVYRSSFKNKNYEYQMGLPKLERSAMRVYYEGVHALENIGIPNRGRPPYERIRKHLILQLGYVFDTYFSAQWKNLREFEAECERCKKDHEDSYCLQIEAARQRVAFVRYVLEYHQENEPCRFSPGLQLPPNTYRGDKDLFLLLGVEWSFPSN